MAHALFLTAEGRGRKLLEDGTCSILAIVRFHSSSEQDCMCAQKLVKHSEVGHFSLASRSRSSVRSFSASVMRPIASLKARLQNMKLILGAAMSAGAEGGRSARIGGGRLIKPTFRPDTSRSGLWPDSGRTFNIVYII